MDAPSELWRHRAASFGLALYAASPFVAIAGSGVKWAWRCGGRTFTFASKFDDCFNDLLPVEFLFVPLMVLTLPLFAVIAQSIWAPHREHRRYRWRLARLGNAGENFPQMAIFAVLLSSWPIWRAISYPFWGRALPYMAFWLLFAAWFLTAVLVSKMSVRPR